MTIQLIVKEHVYDRFAEQYPNYDRKKYIDKYIDRLAIDINKALLTKDGYIPGMESYYVNLTKLNNSGNIGSSKKRISVWLNDNVPIYTILDKGSNFKKTLSRIRLNTQNIEVIDTSIFKENTISIEVREIMTSKNLNVIDVLALTYEKDIDNTLCKKHFDNIYPDFDKSMTFAEYFTEEKYDSVKIDTASMKSYLNWILNSNMNTNAKTRRKELAEQFIAIANITDGIIFQEKKPSIFGRTYYTGYSIQNIPKDLRAAMLGDCYEYDFKQCAISYKMYMLLQFLREKDDTVKLLYELVETNQCKKFSIIYELEKICKEYAPAIDRYLTNRDSFIKNICMDVFNSQSDYYKSDIKRALLAISFGAKLSTNKYQDEYNKWLYGALSTAIKDPVACERFINNPLVKQFHEENTIIDKIIVEYALVQNPNLINEYNLKTKSGKNKSPSKIVAFMYQHYETELMNQFIDYLKSNNYTCRVLCKIHDAIILNNKLSNDVVNSFVSYMKKNDNLYFDMKEIIHSRYYTKTSESELIHESKLEYAMFTAPALAIQEAKSNYKSKFCATTADLDQIEYEHQDELDSIKYDMRMAGRTFREDELAMEQYNQFCESINPSPKKYMKNGITHGNEYDDGSSYSYNEDIDDDEPLHY